MKEILEVIGSVALIIGLCCGVMWAGVITLIRFNIIENILAEGELFHNPIMLFVWIYGVCSFVVLLILMFSWDLKKRCSYYFCL